MQLSYNTNAPRRPVNLTANSDLVNMVRSENGNLSKLLEQTMITFLAERELYRWKEENKASFDSYIGGRLQSYWVAEFNQNGWPTWCGIRTSPSKSQDNRFVNTSINNQSHQ